MVFLTQQKLILLSPIPGKDEYKIELKKYVLNKRYYLTRQIPDHNRKRWIRKVTGQRLFLSIPDLFVCHNTVVVFDINSTLRAVIIFSTLRQRWQYEFLC